MFWTRSRGRFAAPREADWIARARSLAAHPAARGLRDDAAVLTPALGRDLVLTHDMLAEAVHFLPADPPQDVAWKALAVNVSDLAAMGARPVGALLGLGLSAAQDNGWLAAFAEGLAHACAALACPLLGGDTIARVDRLTLGVTALGDVEPGQALSRAGGRAGDDLWVSGSIGDAWLGLQLLTSRLAVPDPAHAARLVAAYRRPQPQVALGLALRGVASACMDVSDGLLLDARRLAETSGCGAEMRLAALPLSRAAEALAADPLALATGGDDYQLLFAAPPAASAAIAAVGRRLNVRLTQVGRLTRGSFVVLGPGDTPIEPTLLGYQHD